MNIFQANIANGDSQLEDTGFNPKKCIDDRGTHEKCWYSQFQPTYARNAFPCLDEPALKATFFISVTRREDYMVRSNMPLLSTDQGSLYSQA